MLYTIAEAAKATGLAESIIFRAIEDGQIHGTRNVSGEWHVEDAELHSSYLSIAQHYCKHQWQTDLQRGDGRGQEPEIANIADNEEGRGGQQHTHTAADQAENSASTPATASIWQNGLRIDNRDRISNPHSLRYSYGVTGARLRRRVELVLFFRSKSGPGAKCQLFGSCPRF